MPHFPGVRKAVVIRPGALGDVLVVREALRFLKDTFPDARVALCAPGERGRFFRRDGWADATYDWEAAAFSWFFSDGSTEIPQLIGDAFAACDLILSFVDSCEGEPFRDRLRQAAPKSEILFGGSRPGGKTHARIGAWLVAKSEDFCRARGFVSAGGESVDRFAACRIAVEGELLDGMTEPYLLVHPGSGSATKNWPIEEYVALAGLLLEDGTRGLATRFSRLVVTAGEADGDLGERLCHAIPGARLCRPCSLEELAVLLSRAALYVGNDSGVSHMAATVRTAGGRHPAVAVVFGASDPGIWSPPGALVLPAGATMDSLKADEAFSRIVTTFSGRLSEIS